MNIYVLKNILIKTIKAVIYLPKFESYVSNSVYDIGCSGQTVYVYDKSGTELARFKDLIYAYYAAISPCGDMFVVKSAEGRLAAYSLETLSLIKKFRYSKVNDSQDDGFCFSADGKYFINLERHGDSLHSAITVYDVTDFSVVSEFLLGEDGMVSDIEESDGDFYVLGFWRDNDGIISEGFVGKFRDGKIFDSVNFEKMKFDYYHGLFSWKRKGNTDEELTLANLWRLLNSKN